MSSLKTKIVVAVFALILIVAIAWPIVWLLGSSNPYTPAGYVGYVTQGAVFGQTKFVKLQTGPTSAGRMWLGDVINVSITPYTYDEDFSGDQQVLAKDNLPVSYKMHILFAIKPNMVREFVERYSVLHQGSDMGNIVEASYANFLKEPLRTYGRDEVQQHDALAIKDNITPIGEKVLARVKILTDTTPFNVSQTVVGNIQYPDKVTQAVTLKLAASQDLEREEINIDIAKKKALTRVAEASGIAAAMDTINQKLTSLYLQHEAIEAQKLMVGSENHTVIYLPIGPMGIPLTGTLDLASSGQTNKK